MTSLYNVKKIVINGNEVNKVATHYNKNMLEANKLKTVISIQALEEAIEKNKVECEFEYNKKHETNTTFDELIVNPTGVADLNKIDNTYNITVKTAGDAFVYKSNSLVNAMHETIYLTSTVKDFDEENVYTLVEDYNISMANEFLKSASGILEFNATDDVRLIKSDFFIDKCGFRSDDIAYLYLDENHTIQATEDVDFESYSKDTTSTRKPKKDVYVYGSTHTMNINYSGDETDWMDYYLSTDTDKVSFIKSTSKMTITALPATVSKIIISDNISKLAILLDTLNTQELIIEANNFNLADGNIKTDLTKLYVNGTYTGCGMSTGTAAVLQLGSASGELHLSSNYFDNVDLDSVEAGTYPFGDFSGSDFVCSKIVVESCDLNTAATGADLIAKLKTILNATNVELE